MSTAPQTLANPAVPAVEIGGLVKRYGQLAAVDGLTLTAARGAVTGILGPSGGGKTTLLSILAGYRVGAAAAGRVCAARGGRVSGVSFQQIDCCSHKIQPV